MTAAKRAEKIQNRTEEIYAAELALSWKRTDRMFLWLMPLQFFAAVIAALMISPRTWIGAQSELHTHVWGGITIAFLIASAPFCLALYRPGATSTRYTIATAQMLISALLIHLTGGRIETHFHVFGSLAFLAFYRDCRLLVVATAVTAADHATRQYLFPMSGFGVLDPGATRWLEHAGWVVFEVVFLWIAIQQNLSDSRKSALRGAQLEVHSQEHAARSDTIGRENKSLWDVLNQYTIFSLADHDGTILDVNDGFCQISGYGKEELVGQNHRILNSGHHPKAFWVEMWRTIASGKPWRADVCNISKEGHPYWVDSTNIPQFDADGRVVRFMSLRFDITAKKRAEEQLVEARQQAEAASKAKTEFLANMSHEIRTPMTAILGYADLLSTDNDVAKDAQKTQEAIETIQKNACHLLSIINDILDVSKIEAGQMSVELIETNLPKLLSEVQALLKQSAESKGLEWSVRFESAVPDRIQSDPTRLRQILLNLASNAIKFTEQGQVSLVVSCDATAQRLTIQVKDTGIGISPDQCSKISQFEAFTQADFSMTRKFGGSGLGLRISNALAQLLGGGISFESSKGQGSTFSLTLKTGTLESASWLESFEDSNSQSIKPAKITAKSTQDNSLEGVRVLLAEDGPDNQRLISHYLKRAGASVKICNNGLEAVEYIEATDHELLPNVVLMDMQMPELDGYGATRRLREGQFSLPILAITAHAMEGEREKCLEAGCDDYLTKPINKCELIQKCTEYARSLAISAAQN